MQNIVNFEGNKSTAFVCLFQYDYGQELIIDGLKLPDDFEVHYSNGSNSALVIRGRVTDDKFVVDIPDEVLSQNTDETKAWIYLDEGKSGRTIKTIVIHLEKREIPSDMPPQEDIPTIKGYAEYVKENAEKVLSAEAAGDRANKVADELLAAKENGEFIGAAGPQGPPGATGPPGKDAVKPLEFMRASKYLNGTFPSLNCCEGRYVYIASYGNIYKVDFGIESSPVEEVKINLNNKMSATGIAIKGQYIYACYRDGSAGTSRNEDIPAGILYVFRKSDLSIVKEIMLDWKPTRVIIHNNLMIVNMQLKGWNMYDITNLQSPSLIYSYRSENEEYQGGTFCEHNERLYYIAGGFGYGLYIYDVTDASVPEKVAEFKFSWYSELNKNVHCYDVVADYPYVYTTVASTYSKDLLTEKDIRGILKLDISDMSLFTADTANLIPYTITQIADEDKAAVNPGGDVMPTKMTRYKDYLLTNTGRNGIAVFDISKDEPIYQRFVQTSKEGIPFTLSTSDDERIIISESMKEKYVHILRPII